MKYKVIRRDARNYEVTDMSIAPARWDTIDHNSNCRLGKARLLLEQLK